MIRPDAKPTTMAFTNGTQFDAHGVEYTLHTRYMGPLPVVGSDRDENFAYGIAKVGDIGYLETGTLAWGPRNGPLTYREAQKVLITYWQTRTQDVEETELDRIVEMCAHWMHAYFLGDDDNTDYDIVAKYIDEDGWTVVLRPNYMANRLVEFYLENRKSGQVTVHSYIEDNELSVQFPIEGQ